MCGRNGAIARAGFGYEMAAIGCTDDCAAQRHDSINTFAIENDVIAGRKKPLKSVAKTNDVPAELFRSQHDSAQHCVQSWTIATAGENPNPRFHLCNSGIRRLLKSPCIPRESKLRRMARRERGACRCGPVTTKQRR